MIEAVLVFLAALCVSWIVTYLLIPRLKRAGIIGKDMNKEGAPGIPEMGGIGVVAGFSAGVLLAIMLSTFDDGFAFNITYVLAALATIHAMAFIGIVDDLLSVPQAVKALLPLLAAVPLIAVKAAGSTSMMFPFIGVVDFGIFYILVLIPVGVAVASNLTNMLAGFNGLEAGLGAMIMFFMAAIALAQGNNEMVVLYIPMLGALLAFLWFNWYPAKVFPGDVGTLTVGAVLASGVIIGNLESAGALIMLLFVADFFIKLAKGFPQSFGEPKMGKLYPKGGEVQGLAPLIMKLKGGITEKKLVYALLGAQFVLSLVVFLLFVRL